MIVPVMKTRFPAPMTLAVALTLLCATLPALAQKKPKEPIKPMAGPRAAATRPLPWQPLSYPEHHGHQRMLGPLRR